MLHQYKGAYSWAALINPLYTTAFICRVEQARHNGADYHGNGCDKLCNPSNIGNLKLEKLSATKYGKSKKSESSNPTCEMFVVDNGDLQTKQALGEKIYSLIENQYPNDAEKLTGILLEMDNQSLEHLIKDTDLLEKKVKEVFSVLQNHTGQIQNGQNSGPAELEQPYNKTSIGEELFELVVALDADQADKITGMLLELDLHDLEELIKNQAALEEKVNQALAALNNQFIKDKEVGEIEKEDKTLLGEQLYYFITEWYPDQADKITGMLLELDITTLNLLVKDSAALKERATHAANVLSNTNIDKEILHDLVSTRPSNSVEESEDKMLSDSEMRRALAEQLYSIVEKWYPAEAGKLTGMLMDNDCAMLKSMVLNEQLLKGKLEEALAVLHRTQQTIPHR